MPMNVPDNYDQFQEDEARKQRWLDSRPKCDYCDRPIQDEKLCDFDGVLICLKCVEDHYTKDTEDYTS